MHAHAWFLFLVASIAICVAPGPDMLFVVSSASRGGARAGLSAVRGITTAMTLHVGAAALGLSAVFAASSTAFNVLRIAGAIYLVWLGIQALRGTTVRATGEHIARDAFRRGFLTNATNPKVIVFFAAFLPQFVVPGNGPVTVQLLILGAAFAAIGLVFDVAIALAAGAIGTRLLRNSSAVRIMDGAAGAVMIVLGIALFSEPRRA